jgi:hypothetical protein
MYKHVHEYILSIIKTFSVRSTSELDDFTSKYFTVFCEFIIDEAFFVDYVHKLISNHIVLDLIKLDDVYRDDVDKFHINVLLQFFNTYTYVKVNRCQNCAIEMPESTVVCQECGSIKGKNFYIEESQKDNYQTNYSFKKKSHNPNKHCDMWLTKLQGKESVNISIEQLNLIYKLAKEEYTHRPNMALNCQLIRVWLKKLELTQFNSNVPWIRRHIEQHLNIPSNNYEFTDDEINQILNMFYKIQIEYDKLKKCKRTLQILKKKSIHNSLYYPYYLIKIIKIVIDDKERVKFIVSNVHSQSTQTIKKNDILWMLICEKINI